MEYSEWIGCVKSLPQYYYCDVSTLKRILTDWSRDRKELNDLIEKIEQLDEFCKELTESDSEAKASS